MHELQGTEGWMWWSMRRLWFSARWIQPIVGVCVGMPDGVAAEIIGGLCHDVEEYVFPMHRIIPLIRDYSPAIDIKVW